MKLSLPLRKASSVPDRRRKDRRWLGIAVTVLAVAGLGYAFKLMPGYGVVAEQAGTKAGFDSLAASIEERSGLDVPVPVEEQVAEGLPNGDFARQKLREASDLIRSRRHDDALRHLTAVRDQLKDVPQTYLVLARALEGKKDYATARDFYKAAIDKDPFMSDAYWGYATSSESLGDLPSALGAMRSYLHTEPDADPYRRRIAQARSAIWEWESKLGRGAWGATKGLPPGFTEAELRRDGRGVGVKMPIPGTENATGVSRYEIKSADKIQVYSR